jgi:hypothetical protein
VLVRKKRKLSTMSKRKRRESAVGLCANPCCATVRKIIAATTRHVDQVAQSHVEANRPPPRPSKIPVETLVSILRGIGLKIFSPGDAMSAAAKVATSPGQPVHNPPRVELSPGTRVFVTYFEDPPLKLARTRAHHRDACIIFDDVPHKYLVHGQPGYTSCTTLMHGFFPPFDAKKISARMSLRSNFFSHEPYLEKGYGGLRRHRRVATGEKATMGIEDWLVELGGGAESKESGDAPLVESSQVEIATGLQAAWILNSNKESGLGTEFHLCAEHFYNDVPVTNDSPEYGYFLEYHKMVTEERDWVPLRTEQMVWMELPPRESDGSVTGLCGSVDMIYVDRMTLKLRDLDAWRRGDPGVDPLPIHVIDWKRSKEISFEAFQKEGTGFGPCAHLPDCNFAHYSLQLNGYAHMLEQTMNVKVMYMANLVCHPNKPTYKEIVISDEHGPTVLNLIKEHLRAANPFDVH